MPKETGGQAFPHFYVWDRDRREAISVQEGMTLRDWFAGQALRAVCDCSADTSYVAKRAKEWAEQSYLIADAMIAERDK